MTQTPEWLQIVAFTWIAICFVSAFFVLIHTLSKPQRMWVMSVVWPITALYLGPIAIYLYRKTLPVMAKGSMSPRMKSIMKHHKDDPPTSTQSQIAVFHCGAGCTIGDVIAETITPALGIAFAGEFGSKLILDFVFAYVLGIVFQYFSIVPMRGLSVGKGIAAAVKADTISISLFEVGMFAWMAITYYWLFPAPHLHPTSMVFWFMMQIAMIVGTLTALPANSWLIRKGWKEKMPSVDPDQMAREMSAAPTDQNQRFAA